MAILKIGTSSFSSKDWVGTFYPEKTKPADFLRYYSTKFNTVEIDSSYYAVPSETTIKRWAENTPGDFIFSLKFPRAIVHGGKGSSPDPELLLCKDSTYPIRDAFLKSVSHLDSRLGPLLLQFPYFSQKAFSSASPFFDKLDRFLYDLPKNYRFCVEIRNKAWLTTEFADLCRKHSAALVLVDHGWMPHGDEVMRRFDPVTTDFTYIRLLGDRKKIEEITTNWDKVVVDHTESLNKWADLIKKLLNRDIVIYTYSNNHYAGHGPATSNTLMNMLK
ncbi:MAG: DUF72 domain-containing protein [Candidatus Electryonea clarkiae]|nr:DUF72 domain-containing protein [Candidatus Electryonea clarkiae]MDP8288000.1 DUF72 domain-containing protein [Candidatus Electryonea clarkiae]